MILVSDKPSAIIKAAMIQGLTTMNNHHDSTSAIIDPKLLRIKHYQLITSSPIQDVNIDASWSTIPLWTMKKTIINQYNLYHFTTIIHYN